MLAHPPVRGGLVVRRRGGTQPFLSPLPALDLKEACLDFAEITCAVGLQRDSGLFELTTGLDANGLPCKTD